MTLLRGTSIRLRITAIAVLSVGGALLVASLTLYAVQNRQLVAHLDAVLAQRADDLEALLTATGVDPGGLASGQLEGFAQVVEVSTGQVIAATPNIADEPPIDIGDPRSGELVRNVDDLPFDADEFRVLTRQVSIDGRTLALGVGTSFDIVTQSLDSLIDALLAAVPLLLALVGILVWWLVGRTLQPVEAIRSEVSVIGSSDLHRRVPVSTYADEIGRLAETMNQMLARMESAMEGQRRFVGDASHELRSPLTRMRAEIEVGLMSGPERDREVLTSVLEEVESLQLMVDDLLYLAGADAGTGPRVMDRVDLDDIVLREGSRLKEAGRVEVDLSGVSGAEVRGDPQQLGRAVRNLCDNAGRHAGSRVALALAEMDGRAVLTVVDDGDGIPPDQVETIFERFTRLDRSRSSDTGGSGLGLAITRDIVDRHRGTIVADSSYEGGARFVVSLPAFDGADPDSSRS